MSDIEILPVDDPFNIEMISHVRPPEWKNPTPDGKYNLVIIGAGSAGLVATSGASQIGAKVAIIEKSFLGGDCLVTGCVPSKAIIGSAHVAAAVRDAAEYGVVVPDGVTTDFSQVMRRLRGVRASIGPHDSAKRFADMGADVYFGTGKFIGPNKIEVAGQVLEFDKALIATGSSARHLPIPGLADTGYITNESVFNLQTQPKSLAVIGAGPIGSELSQSFQRLGTQVTLIDLSDHILAREDADAAALVQKSLLKDGVQLVLGAKTESVEAVDGGKRINYDQNGQKGSVVVDEILLAVGRQPNVNGLGLENVGVEFDKRGVKVDDNLRTTNPDIFAAGDVAVPYQFTHVAGHSGAIVVQNALLPLPKRKFSSLIIPWATFTDPEVAHVGMYPRDAAEKGVEIDTYQVDMDHVDRALTEGDTSGFIKVHTKKGTGTIVGATIVGATAGEMISEITMAMKHKINLGSLSSVIHPYPTQAEAINKVANEYNKTRLGSRVKGILSWWMARSRR